MMNTLEDCDIFEKVISLTNVHHHNDVKVSINVQDFRSRYSKFVYHNCTRVVCKCHGNKRDREPSRKPVKMIRRLSQKSRKLQRYVWSGVRKTIPNTSKVYNLIRNIMIRKKIVRKTVKKIKLRFVQKMRKKPILRKGKLTL